ncbi:MAG: 23S rRNA (guanosine(2251)-2'-O)-methyltransferase RlmB [Bacilli bacterium]|jgi:23S rRNA (guanosine2251-2'-O)-methyltransferase
MNNSVFGRIPVLSSLKENAVKELYVLNSFNDEKILELAKEKKIKINFCSKKELDNLVKGNHQGVVAKTRPFEYSSLETLLKAAKTQQNPCILILDEINDPRNFGAIIRIADAYKVDGILIKKRRQVEVTPTVIKTATGAQNYVPIAQVANLNNAIDLLKREGFWIVATDSSANLNHSDLKYDFPVALIIGSEGFGISKLLLKNADYIVKIPMYGHVNSLNASVACGIILDQIRTKQWL